MADFGKTAKDYATHRAGFPPEMFRRLAARGIGLPGQRALDLGSGTGSLARGWAKQGAEVTALDISAEMLAQAEALSRDQGLTIAFRQAPAERTGLPSGSFDVAAAGQCWHWFDGPAAAREAARVLKPQGTLVIAHFDWLPLPGNMVETTENLIREHSPTWQFFGGTGFYPRWPADVSAGGFGGIETFTFDLEVPYSQEDWRGRVRASAGVGGTLDPAAVAAFDVALAERLAALYPEDPIAVPHRVFVLTATAPSGRAPQSASASRTRQAVS